MQDFVAAYVRYFPSLVAMGVDEFAIEESVSADLANEVFLASLRGNHWTGDPPVWVIAAMRHACRARS